jgi:hypothetical protein
MKIFQIGFNKCGTTSLYKRFTDLGLRAVHHGGGEIALRMHQNRISGRFILDGVDEYDAYTDLIYLTEDTHIEAFKYYTDFLEQVPDARFIYNIRNKDRWLRSCLDHDDFAARMKRCYGYTTDDEVVRHWSNEWDRHYHAVTSTIPPERLLVFNIEKDDARRIDRFVGAPRSLSPTLSHANFTLGPLFTVLDWVVPQPVQRLLPLSARERLRYLVRQRR